VGVDSNASFEIKIAGWVGSDDGGPPTRPEIAAIATVPVLCIYGEGESDSICPDLSRTSERTRIGLAEVGKGHHFSGEYAELAERILAFARARSSRPRLDTIRNRSHRRGAGALHNANVCAAILMRRETPTNTRVPGLESRLIDTTTRAAGTP
jgi:hypothetical protein